MLQMIMLEGAKATTETVDALRTGASAMKAMQKATYVSNYFSSLMLPTFSFMGVCWVLVSEFFMLLESIMNFCTLFHPCIL